MTFYNSYFFSKQIFVCVGIFDKKFNDYYIIYKINNEDSIVKFEYLLSILVTMQHRYLNLIPSCLAPVDMS